MRKWWLTVNDIHLMQIGEITESDIEALVIEEAERWRRNDRKRGRYWQAKRRARAKVMATARSMSTPSEPSETAAMSSSRSQQFERLQEKA